jgi:hypothetical protein
VVLVSLLALVLAVLAQYAAAALGLGWLGRGVAMGVALGLTLALGQRRRQLRA